MESNGTALNWATVIEAIEHQFYEMSQLDYNWDELPEADVHFAVTKGDLHVTRGMKWLNR